MSNWFCKKCKTNNSEVVNRCSFCSEPKPLILDEKPDIGVDKVKIALHNAIEKMNGRQRIQTWNWLENNIL